MKLFSFIGKFIFNIFKFIKIITIVFFISCVATFFLTIFMPENVLQAIEIFKNILKIS